MEEARVRYAVVGLGHIAQVAVLPAFQNAAESSALAALVSSDRTKLDELGKQYGVDHTGTYDELEKLLEDARIDAAYIAVPNSQHREFTERCARAGVHVLCEKPMALNEEDCEAMIRATDEAGVKLMIAYRLHFEEANLCAIDLVESGRIGDPRIFSSIFSQQVREGNIRTRGELGGGALFDMGIYCVNAARYLYREEPLEVCGFTAVRTDERFQRVDEMTSALLRFPGERFAQLTSSLGAADVSTYRIVGTRGELRVEPAYDYQLDLKHYLTVEGNREVRTFPKHDQFGPELAYFSRCILEDMEPEPSGEEGLCDVRVLCAIVESARTGKSVKLPKRDRAQRPNLRQQITMPAIRLPETVHATPPSQ